MSIITMVTSKGGAGKTTVAHILDDASIVPAARKLERKHDLVVIDTAGARSQATIFAIGCADMVLIPMQLSIADVTEAEKTYKLVRSTGKMTTRQIPARIVYTDYTPKTKVAKWVRKEIQDRDLPVMSTRLHHLVAFKELTFNGKVPRKGAAGAQGKLLVQELNEMGYLPFMRKYKRAS